MRENIDKKGKKMKIKIIIPILLSLTASNYAFSLESDDILSNFYISVKAGESINKTTNIKSYNNTPMIDVPSDIDEPIFTIGSNSGVNSFGSNSKGRLAAGIGFGYDFYGVYEVPIRSEVDLTFRSSSKLSNSLGKVSVTTLMLTNYYDFRNTSDFTPYVSFGVGLASVRAKLKNGYIDNPFEFGPSQYIYKFNDSNRSNHFAWSLGLGAKYLVDTDVAIDFGYRFIDTGSAEVSDSKSGYKMKLKGKTKVHDILLGVSYLL